MRTRLGGLAGGRRSELMLMLEGRLATGLSRGSPFLARALRPFNVGSEKTCKPSFRLNCSNAWPWDEVFRTRPAASVAELVAPSVHGTTGPCCHRPTTSTPIRPQGHSPLQRGTQVDVVERQGHRTRSLPLQIPLSYVPVTRPAQNLLGRAVPGHRIMTLGSDDSLYPIAVLM